VTTVAFLLLIPVWIVICARNEYVRDVLYHGWYEETVTRYVLIVLFRSPIVAAMLISRYAMHRV
jgi:hypothetical protein